MAKFAALIFFLIVFSLFRINTFAAENLLQNGGFEEEVSIWQTFGSTISQSADFKKNGNYSGKVETTTTNSGTKYVYQAVLVESGKSYQASAFILKQGENTAKASVVFAFYASTDGSGSQIGGKSYSSNIVEGNDTNFSQVQTDVVEAPENTQSAKIRLSIIMPQSADEKGAAYFDEVEFKEVAPQPPTQSSTSSPSPNTDSVKSPSPTPLPSPTPSKYPSPSPQKTILGQSTQSATSQAMPFLPSPSPLSENGSSNTKTAAMLAGSGLILIGLSAAFYVWYSKLLGNDKSKKPDKNEDDENIKF
ncbi:MAG: hypothetical protein WD988_01885 [Candidatus Curtissbacteria bacterium]